MQVSCPLARTRSSDDGDSSCDRSGGERAEEHPARLTLTRRGGPSDWQAQLRASPDLRSVTSGARAKNQSTPSPPVRKSAEPSLKTVTPFLSSPPRRPATRAE